MYDLVIVGGGPSGISCAVESRRLGLNVVLIEKKDFGGCVKYARKIENFPPFYPISGRDLAKKFEDFFLSSNIDFVKDRVEKLSYISQKFIITLQKNNPIETKSVYVATGQRDKIPDEYIKFKDLIKKSEEAFCEDYENREVLVYGGGDVAFDLSLSLAELKAKVVIFSRGEIKAKPCLVKEAQEKGILFKKKCELQSIELLDERKLVVIKDPCSQIEIYVDEIIFAVGKEPEMPLFELPFEFERGSFSQIATFEKIGLFAGGDLIRGRNRNVGIAVGDGISAAFAITNFLKGEKND